MIRVVEDPTGTPLNTDYVFDTLGNLRRTTQGDQNRYFMHDSLGRLLFARQVEQDTNGSFSATDPVTGNTAWTEKYEYNDNGNITKTTDARNKYVEATYDHLNRIIVRNYEESATPDVNFYYDGTGLASVPDFSNGKTTKVTSSASETKYMSFDIFGRLLTHRQTTDSHDYDTEYKYNLGGAMIEETYPSGRVVKNTLDQDGNLSQVQSKKNSGSGYWTYADAISRDSSGNVKKMQLGNGRWETASYNTRGQIMQIGLGTTDATQDLLKLEYKYDTNTTSYDNNGSMREQKITVPTVGSTSGFTATQTYLYDDLNRLGSAEEKVSGSTTWKQTFDIDRYGNRRFNTTGSNTTTLGSCSTAVCNPTISTSTNRISSSGYTFDANGSLTANAAGERFGYDAEKHQTAFFLSTNSGSTPDATYVYDGEGRRIKKVSSTETTIFVYDGGGQMIAEYSTALATTPQVSYLTQDHLGSPRVITNENGKVINRKDFMAYGDQATSSQRVSGTGGNGYDPADVRQDYTGYQKDSESGLEFAQARYYNPTHGRFTSIDPLMASATIKNPQTFNRYSYVQNSPYKFVDPLGLISSSTGASGDWREKRRWSVFWSTVYGAEDDYDKSGAIVSSTSPTGTNATAQTTNPPPPPYTITYIPPEGSRESKKTIKRKSAALTKLANKFIAANWPIVINQTASYAARVRTPHGEVTAVTQTNELGFNLGTGGLSSSGSGGTATTTTIPASLEDKLKANSEYLLNTATFILELKAADIGNSRELAVGINKYLVEQADQAIADADTSPAMPGSLPVRRAEPGAQDNIHPAAEQPGRNNIKWRIRAASSDRSIYQE